MGGSPNTSIEITSKMTGFAFPWRMNPAFRTRSKSVMQFVTFETSRFHPPCTAIVDISVVSIVLPQVFVQPAKPECCIIGLDL